MEVSGELLNPSALTLGNVSRFLFHLELGGPRNRNGCNGEEKIHSPDGNRLQRVQIMASHFIV
jgi:hypothetical protein